MVDYNPAVSAAAQVLPFEDLPSTDTPVTADWLNHVDDVLDDIAASGGRIADLEAITANLQTGTTYTLVLTDAGKVVEMNNASSNVLTVPPNASVAFPTGTVLEIGQYGAGQTTVAAGVGVTIRTPATLILRTQYSTVTLRKRGTNEWWLSGDVQ